MPSYLITGSSRGLGLAFVKELLKDQNNKVIATARNTAGSSGLQALAKEYPESRLNLLDLDVMKPESCSVAAEKVGEILPTGLDNLISNAGVSFQSLVTFDELDVKLFEDELIFNTVTIINVFKAFLPLLRKGTEKKILALTSELGSIELGAGTPNLANTYSVGKAALNMLVRRWSAVLKTEGITAFVIHPGWVNSTDIGDSITEYVEKYAPSTKSISEPESAEGCMKVLKNVTVDDAGAFYNYDGTNLPW